VVSQALRLGGNLIMTRLLVPEMFGVMAIANVVLVGLALFSDLGLRQNIIQSKRGDDPSFLNTVWSVQIVRGCMIWFLAMGLSIGIHLASVFGIWSPESVYAEPMLPFVIGAIALSAVINGFESTKIAIANRNLLFGIVIRIEVTSQVAGLLAMIAWALIDRSIWALVIGSLFGSCLKTILSHIWLPGLQNKLHWDGGVFLDIFHFGKWVFLASIVGFLAANGDRLLLGGLIDARNLGLYSIAILMVHSFRLVIQSITSSVAFPALSEVARERPLELKQVYYKFRRPLDIVLLLLIGLLFISGHSLVAILYDDRYLGAGQMLEILSLGLLMERYNLAEQCFLSLGKPKLLVPLKAIQVCVLFFLLPLMHTLYGLQGALWVVATARLASLPLVLYFQNKTGLLDAVRELQVLPVLLVGCSFGYLIETVLAGIGVG